MIRDSAGNLYGTTIYGGTSGAGVMYKIDSAGLGTVVYDPRGVIAEHADKLRDILARLDAVLTVADMDVPGLRLHPLKGRERGFGR